MKNYIILFDGVCNLCNSSVSFIIRNDKRKVFRYASLQSTIAANMLSNFEINDQVDSVFLIKQNRLYQKSDAAFEIIKEFNFFWKLLLVFKIVPKFIRDSVYDYIAKNRYKWFGKKEVCMIPTKELKSLFLD